jgi:hypothetical protein
MSEDKANAQRSTSNAQRRIQRSLLVLMVVIELLRAYLDEMRKQTVSFPSLKARPLLCINVVATPLWGVCIFEAVRSGRRTVPWLQRVRIDQMAFSHFSDY